MNAVPSKIGLYYHEDAYQEMPAEPPKGRGGEPRILMGRRVAGQDFLDAYLRHGACPELVGLVPSAAAGQAFNRLCQGHPGMLPRNRRWRTVNDSQFHKAFLPTPPAP